MRHLQLFVFLVCGSLLPGMLQAQPFEVLGHWTFDNPQWEKANKGEMAFFRYGGQQQESGGASGGFLRLDRENNNTLMAEIELDGAFTVEYWIRFLPDAFNPNARGLSFSDGSMAIFLNMRQLQFYTTILTSSGKKVNHPLLINMGGPGRKSLDYYLDGAWHHFVAQYNPATGQKALWVDGKCPEGFSATVAERGRLCTVPACFKRLYLSYKGRPDWPLLADVDELVVYRGYVPPGVHQQHYSVGKKQKGKYEWTPSRQVLTEDLAETADPQESQLSYDPAEFPPGYPEIQLTPIEQLQQFPLARYQKGHSLRHLYNWMEPIYFGGRFSPGITEKQAIQNSTNLMEEMAENWHYSITLHNTNTIPPDPSVPGSIMHAWIGLANRRPDLAVAATTFWSQTKILEGKNQRRAHVYWKDNPPSYYLRNNKGQFIGVNGSLSKQGTYISPANPGTVYQIDGQNQRRQILRLVKALKRPLNYINENGEVPPLPLPASMLQQDPAVVADFNKSRLGSWEVYQARQKTRMRQLYSNPFLGVKGLENTIFSWYGVDGGPLDRFEWIQARKIQTPQNGMYYSTPDLYPRWPENWAGWAGAWRGFAWLDSCRKVEILAGDKLFSPFVAPGWGYTERNLRPSHWLGMLKHIGVIGGEFMYTGYFNEDAGPGRVSDPKLYAWQAVIPAYAQAITSRYESILREGNVLFTPKGRPIIRHKTSDPRILITIRKAAKESVFVIAANINPSTNLKGDVPDEKMTWVILEGDTLRFPVKRQGSVYVYERQGPNGPLFYQLDSWHETGHPSFWSRDFQFEAEVWDSNDGFIRITERPGKRGDFRSFTTFTRASKSGARMGFRMQPRAADGGTYNLLVRARSRQGTKIKLKAYVNGKAQGQWKCIQDEDWAWYNLSECGDGKPFALAAETESLVELESLSMDLEVDQVLIERKK